MTPRLLAISDRRRLDGRSWQDWIADLARSGVEGLQIREKDLDDRGILALAESARRSNLGLWINGRADIAWIAAAEGVHLPVRGVSAAALRERFGEGLSLGCSTHDLREVEAARDAGADFVTFGPVFSTPGKGESTGLDGLAAAVELGLPVLALGGVMPERLDEVRATGAHGVAGIRVFHDRAALSRLVEAWKRLASDGSDRPA
ncbi:MAG: thiamine phosphate synthase [Acidobacteriota bacterium]